MKSFVIFACLLVSALGFDKEEWQKYKQTYGKAYQAVAEDEYRLKIYLEKKDVIEKHNELYEKKLSTYKMGINKFTDMTAEELSVLTSYKPMEEHDESGTPYSTENLAAPPSIDWRNYGCVVRVQDQGACGSCYSFAALGALEGQYCLLKGVLKDLSEQQVVDCGRPYGLYGCDGGNMELVYNYIGQVGGINLEADYPYRAREETCKFNSKRIAATDTGYYYIPSSNENKLRDAVGTYGPIAVAIDVENSFYGYSGGVYYEPNYKVNFANHGVLVVGYGTDNGQDYWLVKNSWGVYWGESGYIRIARNRGNNLNIATWPTWPTLS